MISEPFASGDSFLHRLDPRVRILAAAAYSFTVALSYRLPNLLAALVLALALVALARLPLNQVLPRLKVVLGFLLLLWLVLPWSYQGTTVARLGPLAVSREGLLLASQITLKSVAILLALIALLATMTTARLGHAMNQMRIPDKLVFLILITYRYIFVIEQEYQKLWRAARIRNFRPGTNLHTYRTYAYLIGMLFVRAAARAKRVHQAMKCRCFQGKFHTLEEFASGRREWLFAAVMLLLLTGMAVYELAPAAVHHLFTLACGSPK
ncbi:MAG: cobalt ECF transporter T component CbiQ [Deltaproteobacteria bacterium]|nr:cobalt ECF transporter T component CbiQ [Deltaproteobacteria bacterium]